MTVRSPNRCVQLMLLVMIALLAVPASADWPGSWGQAKAWSKKYVYYDQNRSDFGSLYCGCQWDWKGRSGGRVDFNSCGYEIRAQENRAKRIEYEHVVPAWVVGHQRQCWQKGGRKECDRSDPTYKVAATDLHNLAVSVGEPNADRSNYRFQPLPSTPHVYGACESKVDFKQRAFEPRDEAKGHAARIWFYMADRYGLQISRQQQQLFAAWDRTHPVSDWERERDRRIARITGVSNPFVTGKKTWRVGQKVKSVPMSAPAKAVAPVEREENAAAVGGSIRGNRNSRVYHLPGGLCPSYGRVSKRNRVPFANEREAQRAGFRKAGNCRG